MMLLFRISVQLSVEPLIKLPTRSETPSMLERLPVYFYLVAGRIQLDCFGRSACSQCHYTIRRKAFFVFAVVYEQCYDDS